MCACERSSAKLPVGLAFARPISTMLRSFADGVAGGIRISRWRAVGRPLITGHALKLDFRRII